jgi:O-antigen/teichoic acid export membrane protein
MTSPVSVRGVTAMARTTVSLLAARVAALLLGIGLTVILAARLGLEGFGEFAFVGAIVFVANVVTTFGTDMVLIRDIAGRGRMDRCAPALALQLALSAVAIAVVTVVTLALPGRDGDVASALRLMSLSLVPSAVFSVCTAALRGHARMHAYAAVSVMAAATPLMSVAVLVPRGAGVVRAVTVAVGAQFAIAAVAWAICAALLPHARLLSRVSPREVASMARASAPVGAFGVLGVAYQRCGAIAVSLAAGPAATGLFAGALRIVEASRTGHVALFASVYPAMAEAYADRTSNPVTLRWSWRLSVVSAVLISGALLLLGPTLVDHLYGAAFGPAKPALAILAVGVVPSTIAAYQSLALLAADRARDGLRALSASLATLVAATAALIPAVGWIGACWALVIADTTNAALMTAARVRARSRGELRSAMLGPTVPARGAYG